MLRPVQTMISLRAGRISFTSSRDARACFALRRALALRRLGLDGADVAVEHRPVALDDVVLVVEAAPDDVGEERGCVAGKHLGWLHGAVSFELMNGNGGDLLPDIHPPPRSRPSSSSSRRVCRDGGRTAPGWGAAGVWRPGGVPGYDSVDGTADESGTVRWKGLPTAAVTDGGRDSGASDGGSKNSPPTRLDPRAVLGSSPFLLPLAPLGAIA